MLVVKALVLYKLRNMIKEGLKKALIELFMAGELPFKFLKHEAFINYTHAFNGRVLLPSRHKLSRDVSKYYLDERIDNAPSNDKAIGYLIKKFPNARLYDDMKHFHVRCMAHVLNLIVQEGLKVKNYHVECLSNAVRYIRQSTQRIKKFKACMKESSLESNRFLSGECPTRWNSKHDMLKITIELRDAFF
ncbi:zinc finger BED domain-containing protein RICESLEEPER 2 [Tanacetum coccineum]